MSNRNALRSATATLRRHRLVMVSPRAHDFLPAARLSPPETIVCLEGGESACAVAQTVGAPLYTLEHQVPLRRPWSNLDLDALAPGIPPRAAGRDVAIVSYAATAGLRAALVDRDVLAGPSTQLKHWLDDKIATRAAAADLGVPVPETIVRRKAALRFDELARDLGSPFVVQRRRGSCGTGTFLIREPADLDRISGACDTEQLLVSRHRGAVALNVHGIVGVLGTQVRPPSVQLAGVAELAGSDPSCGDPTYCGNDFTAVRDLSATLLAQLCDHTRTLAEWLRRQGFAGAFGADYVSDGTRLWFIEINPRLQGSSWLLGEAELAHEAVPTIAAHLVAMLEPALPPAGPCMVDAAQLLFRWRGPAAVLNPDLTSGIYSLTPAGLRLKRRGIGLLECDKGEVLLTGMPARGCLVEPGAVVLRAAASARWAGASSESLSPEASILAAALNARIASWADRAAFAASET